MNRILLVDNAERVIYPTFPINFHLDPGLQYGTPVRVPGHGPARKDPGGRGLIQNCQFMQIYYCYSKCMN